VTAITLPTSDSDHTQHDRSQRQRLYRYYSTPKSTREEGLEHNLEQLAATA
jgi:hypothetical protein